MLNYQRVSGFFLKTHGFQSEKNGLRTGSRTHFLGVTVPVQLTPGLYSYRSNRGCGYVRLRFRLMNYAGFAARYVATSLFSLDDLRFKNQVFHQPKCGISPAKIVTWTRKIGISPDFTWFHLISPISTHWWLNMGWISGNFTDWSIRRKSRLIDAIPKLKPMGFLLWLGVISPQNKA